jgi:hypothetical protein
MQFLKYFRDCLRRQRTDQFSVTNRPIQVLDLVGQDCPRYRQPGRKRDFKRITFDMTGDGAKDG